MPGPWLTWDQVVRLLRKQVGKSQKAWAARHEISEQYVSDVLSKRRLPGDKITRAMGLEKALLWRTSNR